MEQTTHSHKKRAIQLFGCFLAGMLILTVVARGLYASRLPKVSAETLHVSALRYAINGTGTVCATQECPVFPEPSLRIAAVCVRVGDTVAAGDVLLRYDPAALEERIFACRTQLQIDTLTQREQIAAGAKTSAEIMALTLEAEQRELDRYEALSAAGAVLCSPLAGTVRAVQVENGGLTAETAAFLLADAESPLEFVATLPAADSKLLAIGDGVMVSFRNGKLNCADCRITARTAMGDSGDCQWTIALAGDNCQNLQVGEVGLLSVQQLSPMSYDCIPREALHTSGSQAFVFQLTETNGFLGTEYQVVKRNVTVVAEDETQVAITGSGLTTNDSIITDASVELYGGEIVRVWMAPLPDTPM